MTIQKEYPSRSIEKASYYVVMTDKFMSGWGQAQNKTNKFIVGCDTFEQAEQIKNVAKTREEMKHINITTNKPFYNRMAFIVSYIPFAELGTIWTGIEKS